MGVIGMKQDNGFCREWEDEKHREEKKEGCRKGFSHHEAYSTDKKLMSNETDTQAIVRMNALDKCSVWIQEGHIIELIRNTHLVIKGIGDEMRILIIKTFPLLFFSFQADLSLAAVFCFPVAAHLIALNLQCHPYRHRLVPTRDREVEGQGSFFEFDILTLCFLNHT